MNSGDLLRVCWPGVPLLPQMDDDDDEFVPTLEEGDLVLFLEPWEHNKLYLRVVSPRGETGWVYSHNVEPLG